MESKPLCPRIEKLYNVVRRQEVTEASLTDRVPMSLQCKASGSFQRLVKRKFNSNTLEEELAPSTRSSTANLAENFHR